MKTNRLLSLVPGFLGQKEENGLVWLYSFSYRGLENP